MGPTVENGSALGTKQRCPAGRIASSIGVSASHGLRPNVFFRARSKTLVDGKELDREAHRAQRFHLVADVRRDRLGRTTDQHDFERRLGRSGESRTPGIPP